MLKFVTSLGLVLLSTVLLGQFKPHLNQIEKNPGAPHQIEDMRIRPLQPAVPVITRPFGNLTTEYRAIAPAVPGLSQAPVKLYYGEGNTRPIAIYGTADARPKEGTAQSKIFRHLSSLEKYMNIEDAAATFKIVSSATGRDGEQHFRLQQYHQGVKVYGGELTVHFKGDLVDYTMGRYFPAPQLASLVPVIEAEEAAAIAKADISKRTTWTDMSAEMWEMLQLKPVESELVIYHPKNNAAAERLTWRLKLVPNIYYQQLYYVDAMTGEILFDYNNLCKMDHDHSVHEDPSTTAVLPPDGPATANRPDLNGLTQQVRSYIVNDVYYLVDASRNMFNFAGSNLPENPSGAIWTLDAENETPIGNDDFGVKQVFSFNNQDWPAGAVSAHYNAGIAYEYFRTTHQRNSINGQAGNIISIINVADEDGGGFDNAFWSGSAMFYGNGATAFDPLAGALDVAGHEMSHGVVQTTANLEYLSQSGALNESFADIFGAMIDRDDWLMGEDVVRTNVFPSGALRNLADPNNGGSGFGSRGWQPAHMNEFVNLPETEEGDNGGVHVNSGIPNKAFFLFASQVGKNVAEEVFYDALNEYLTRFSQFIDLRLAVLQAAQSRGQSVVNAAASAFDQVGIVGDQGTDDEQEEVPINPGDEFIVFADGDKQALRIVTPQGTFIANPLVSSSILSKPSITDDGSVIVFVDGNGNIQSINIDWSTRNASFEALTSNGIWRNAAISKDGQRLAALTDDLDNRLWVFRLDTGNGQDFELFNPSTAQGVSTGDVSYADVLEWDFSGEFVLYDALSELNNLNGTVEFWDIGFIRVWDNNTNNFGNGFISKLFSGLPDNTSVGNPTFSKNSPNIIAMDWLQDGTQGPEYYIVGVNTQNGDSGTFWQNLDLGFPNFSVDDQRLIFDAVPENSTERILGSVQVAADKINPVGNAFIFLQVPNQARWGTWFGTGNRTLTDTEEALSVENALKVYPNPFRQELQVEIKLPNSTPVQISLFDGFGRSVRQERSAVGAGAQSFQLNWAGLANGTYWLRIEQDGKRWGRRVVKIQ
ncbi:MAG: M4 family metallopeptidase [Saprospiraceae bacterium]|nr:M4 family metallopeptidase [Saprospiraceae bacterium]